MEGLENETLKLINDQLKRRAEIEYLIQNCGTISTRLQHRNKIQALENFLQDYQETHNKILQKGKPDIPYIANNTSGKMIDKIQHYLEDLMTQSSMGSRPEIDPEQSRKLKLLRIKKKKLIWLWN